MYRSLNQSYEELLVRFNESKAEEARARDECDEYREQCECLQYEMQQLRAKMESDGGALRAELDAQRKETLRLTHVIDLLRLELDESKREKELVRAH